MNLVSIVTPAYNCAWCIEETIHSVLNQDYPTIEHIIVDDGSTDGTARILDDYKSLCKIIHKTNSGEQYAVNRGLYEVTGKYFIILNADDLLLPNAVEKLVDVMEANPDILCAYPDYRVINEAGEIVRRMRTREYDFEFMVRHHFCIPSVGSMVRASVLETVGYRDTQFKYVGDYDYWLRVGLVGEMMRVPLELACWRESSNQATRNGDDVQHLERKALLDKFYNYVPSLQSEPYAWMYLVSATLSSGIRQKVSYIFKAIKSYPVILFTTEFWHSVYKYTASYLRERVERELFPMNYGNHKTYNRARTENP